MAKRFHELGERLLRAGVAPRHVRRYLTELAEHLADLTAEEERAGRNRARAEGAALARLGRTEDLAQTMIERRELRSWTARAPWAVLGLGPVLALIGAWAVALGILWTGWQWFESGAATPFGARAQGFAFVYFGVGRMLYYWAPVLVGWGIVALAGRQRLQAWWPAAGAMVVALLGATGAVDVRPPTAPGEAGDVGMRFFPASAQMEGAVLHALLLFALTAVPYIICRWKAAQREPGQVE